MQNHTETLSKNDLFNDEFFNTLRQVEFSRLDENKQVYFDFTGGNLYPSSIINTHFEYLKNNVFGNPHSLNPTSMLSSTYVDEARKRVISFFNANDYFCVFTQNASASLQIIGECYPFNEKSHYLLSADNHNSVNGIREYCRTKKGGFTYIPLNSEDLTIDEEFMMDALKSHNDCENKLFAFPAQSNVSGVKHPLNYVEIAHQNNWDVLLDAAAFVPTSKLDLEKVKPDFVTVSFYKMFGYPTGIGCLLIKKSKFEKLQKPWFAGGTVTMVGVKHSEHFLANNHERFENGTVNYLDIPAVTNGLNFIENIGIDNINKRVASITKKFIADLTELKHSNGNPILKMFAISDLDHRGGNVIMSFFDMNNDKYSFEDVEHLANSKNISVRTGCFCNPGIDEINNCVTNDEVMKYFTICKEWSHAEMVTYFNKLRGAIRVSVGISTTQKDLQVFIDFVNSFKDKSVTDFGFTK